MKGLLFLLIFVLGLTACTMRRTSDPDIVYDLSGKPSLTEAAKEKIVDDVVTLLQGYGLQGVKLVGEIEVSKRAIFSAKGGGCTLEFYRDPKGPVSLIIEKKKDSLKAVSFGSREELRQKALQVNCILPAS